MPSKVYYILFLPLFFVSCMKQSVDPSLDFSEVQSDVYCRSGSTAPCEDFDVDGVIDGILDEGLTAEQAVWIAVVNNPGLQSTYQKIGVARAQVVQAGLLKNPIFSFGYLFSNTAGVTNLIEMSLLQNFLELLLIPLKVNVATESLEETKAMVTSQVLELIADTKIAFYTYQSLLEELEFHRQIASASQYSFEAAEKIYEAGNTTELQVTTLKLAAERSQLALLDYEERVSMAYERLNVLMGLTCPREWHSIESLPDVPDGCLEEGCLIQLAIENSLNLKMLRHQICRTAAQYGIDTTRIVFPAFDVGIGSQREDSIWYVGPAFNFPIPIFDQGFAIQAQGRAELCRLWKMYQDQMVKIAAAVRVEKKRLEISYKRYWLLADQMTLTSEQLNVLTLQQYNAMQLGVFELLANKTLEYEIEKLSVAARRETLVRKVELDLLLSGQMKELSPQ